MTRRGALLALAALIVVAGTAAGLLLHGDRLRPLPAGTEVALRGHYDLDLSSPSSPVPVFLGIKRKIGFCVSPPAEVDSSRWSARLTLGGAPLEEGRSLPPAVRMEATLCFEAAPPVPPPEGVARLCARLRDGDERSGAEYQEICRPLRFGKDGKRWAALQDEWQELMARRSGRPLASWLVEQGALARRIAGAGFPVLAVQTELVAIDFCRHQGTPPALAEARRRLSALPTWLDRPEASWSGGQAAQEAATVERDGLHLERAWKELRQAERRYLRVASPYRFTVAVPQAEILALVGAPVEAAERLRAALAECARTPCEEYFLPSLYAQLSWLTLLDPDASAGELEEARGLLQKTLASPQAAFDPTERINWQVNLAYLDVRQGHDPRADLRPVRELLAHPAGVRERFLLGWTDLIAGRAALNGAEPDEALALCGQWTGASDLPRLAARALSCSGAAYRRKGERERALWSFEQAILLHEVAGPAQLGQRLPLGPGQRADDYYEAARLALELGEPGRAWDLLLRLDGLAAGEEGERRCVEDGRDPERARLRAATASERERLLAQVLALDIPASGERRRQLETVRRALNERLQELSRRTFPCAAPAPAAAMPLAGYRAVALRDEVLLLHRDARGGVTLDHRTPFDRREIRLLAERVSEELDRRTLSDADWRRLLAPLAPALVPLRRSEAGNGAGPEVLRYSLHGPLQGVPLAALPIEVERSSPPWLRVAASGVQTGKPLWFSDLAILEVVPAGVVGSADPGPAPRGGPLFVVDPRGDLPGGGDLASFYARTFPAASVLRGAEAVRSRFRASLAGAAFLHLDTHGLYDPAFPELSSLLLADGPVTFSELADLPTPRRLVNLSACRTGQWPITADSGQYGLAGLFARRGATWVVASRSDLDDGVAREFNRAFYDGASSGERGGGEIRVAEGYWRALARVRGEYPAVDWGGLLLLGAGEVP